jgi:CheY-like chemotaxis protein
MPLTRRGFDVLLAEDGAKGVAMAERPDLTLMDMSLPVVDGWEATRRLQGGPSDPGDLSDKALRKLPIATAITPPTPLPAT